MRYLWLLAQRMGGRSLDNIRCHTWVTTPPRIGGLLHLGRRRYTQLGVCLGLRTWDKIPPVIYQMRKRNAIAEKP